jgi:hypothetical protein
MEENRRIVMKELENKVNKKSVEICNEGKSAFDTMKQLSDLMKCGTEEFELKLGRPMTYAEMRQMWG